MAASAPLLRLLMGAPEAWSPGGGGASVGGSAGGPGPPPAAAAPAIAARWARVVAAVLLRCGRDLIAWLEVRAGWGAWLCQVTLGPRLKVDCTV